MILREWRTSSRELWSQPFCQLVNAQLHFIHVSVKGNVIYVVDSFWLTARTLTSTSAQWGGRIFKSKITNLKPKNVGNIALNRPWKGLLLRSWKLKQEGFCLSSAETHKPGTLNFLPLCAYPWMIAKLPVSINLNLTNKF